MQFSFDPSDRKEAEIALKILSVMHPERIKSEDDYKATVTESELTDVATLAEDEAQRRAEATTDEQPADEPVDQIDDKGMRWNADIHSTPPKKNADGRWKQKRNCKEQYEAAYAALAAEQDQATGAAMMQTQEPETTTAPTMMPGTPTGDTMPGMPGSDAPAEPPKPLTYEEVGTRFTQHVANFPNIPFGDIYRDLHIDVTTFATDQSAMRRVWDYMDAIEAGMDYMAATAKANG